MIYLIRSSVYDSITDKHEFILKIGYTGEDNWKKRLSSYYSHNPGSELLYVISDCTLEDEDKLQYYFREYVYNNSNYSGNEWFYCRDEILDYFKTHKTKLSLSDLPEIPSDKLAAFNNFKCEVRTIVEYVLKLKIEKGELDPIQGIQQVNNLVTNIIDRKNLRTISSVWEFIIKTFNIYPPEIDNLSNDIKDEVSNFMIRFNSYTQYTQKMKYLCESNLSKKALSIVLAQIPLEYSSYFNILGPEKIRSFGYKKGELEKACKKVLEGQIGGDVEKLILANFNIGDRITLFDAKEKLKLLYKENNIQFSPKARTLEDYFDVKKTRVKNSEGKFVDGYEILSLK